MRLLLATDAASEGINMQECCRWIIHYDIPWSPSKLQQRNGRVSRHGQVRDVSVHYFRCDEEEDMDFLFRGRREGRAGAARPRQRRADLRRRHPAPLPGQDRPRVEQVSLFVEQEIAGSPEKNELGHYVARRHRRPDPRAKELLESTDTRLGISPQALVEILRAAIAVEGQGSLEEITGQARASTGSSRRPGGKGWPGRRSPWDHAPTAWNWCSTPPWSKRRSPAGGCCGSRSIRCLLRLGHPIMRQAMATLCRQLHDPDRSRRHLPLVPGGAAPTGFEALLVFHYTVTAINELREPLHDEVRSTVFRVEGGPLGPRRG